MPPSEPMETGYRYLAVALTIATLAIGFPSEAHADKGPMRSVFAQIRPGDSLGKIAARYGVSLSDLKKWNPEKTRDENYIRVGDALLVMVPAKSGHKSDGEYWETKYEIRSGDNLGKIAARLNVTIADLRAWNNLKPGAPIRSGDQLTYRVPGKKPQAKSIGRPTQGTVTGAEHLGQRRGYRLRFPKNAWGIRRVNRTIRRCIALVARKHPGTADLLVGDISKPDGGRFPPHQSHQTGRDADIGYYLSGNLQNKTMHRVGPKGIDPAKNWDILRCLITRDRVVRVFMDRALQKEMVKYLRWKKLASNAQLARLFEVAAKKRSDALIRHAPAHDTHIHVRFACDSHDKGCKEEKNDKVFTF